jgi:flavin-dependent dehydrogenase
VPVRAPEICDVVVIGGGPAGSTAGNLLARAGRHVVVLEKEAFPRFHIGESLLPFNVPLLDELGVREEVERMAVAKHGARFVTGDGRHVNTIYFRDGLKPCPPSAYQVLRSRFDEILLDACARRGADVRQGHAAVALQRDHERWRIEIRAADGEHAITCPFLIDASGRDTFMASRNRTKAMSRAHRRIAIYAHFENVLLDPGIDAGNIVLVALRDGWFWVIPIGADRVSIGLVADGDAYRASGLDPAGALAAALRSCPEMRRRTEHARCVSEVHATSNYSYTSAKAAGDGYAVAGDAYAFLDPIFSSGVWLAMYGGRNAAEVIDRCLARPERARALLARHARTLARTSRRYFRFAEYFYRPEFIDVFLQPTDRLALAPAVTSVLAGSLSARPGLRLRLALFFLAIRLQRHLPLRPALARDAVFATG